MNNTNDFFSRMCKEAMEELASGKVGWKEADTNTLFLACFGMLTNHLTSKIVKPLWFFVGCAITATMGYIVTQVIFG